MSDHQLESSFCVTRLAPSPTGGLHLGNARTFLVNWAIARQRNWRIAFRIDDLDSPRIKPGADKNAIEDLNWLGLDWDSPIEYQSNNLEYYANALRLLAQQGKIYPCHCTRSQIAARAASAPNEGDHELRYNGHCRPVLPCSFDFDAFDGECVAWRLVVEPGGVSFFDHFMGSQQFDVEKEVGDFLVSNKQGMASYQLAVNFDDQLQGVTDVIRGDDLLSSSARQILIRRALDMPEKIHYWHLPLIVGADGLRLAKRHCDTSLGLYRERGVVSQRVIGLIAKWCGREMLEPMFKEEFLAWFDIERLPKKRVVFDDCVHRWLLGIA